MSAKLLKHLTKNPFFNVKSLLEHPGRKYEMFSPRKNKLQYVREKIVPYLSYIYR